MKHNQIYHKPVQSWDKEGRYVEDRSRVFTFTVKLLNGASRTVRYRARSIAEANKKFRAELAVSGVDTSPVL